MSGKGRGVGAWSWSAVNAVGLAAVLAVLPLTGLPANAIIAGSVWIASMQAAQAAIVQSSGWTAKVATIRLVTVSLLVLIGILLQLTESNLLVLVLSCVGGVVFGVGVSLSLSQLLASGLPYEFQAANAKRTAAIGLAAVASIVTTKCLSEADFMAVFVVIISMLIPVFIRNRSSESVDLPRPTMQRFLVVAAGVATSLIYRNDVNWLRAAAAVSTDFVMWHYAFLIYSAVQAFLGIALVNHVYSQRERFAVLSLDIIRMHRTVVAGCLALTLVIVILILTTPLNSFVALVPAVLCAFASLLLSAVAHINGWSLLPYAAGTLGVVGLGLSLHFGRSVQEAWAIELLTILAILASGVVALVVKNKSLRTGAT